MKILLIDRDAKQRKLFNVYLEKIFPNADILTSESCGESRKIVDKFPHMDLIIADFVMNDGNAGDLYSHIREHNYGIPFILFSAEVPQVHHSFSTFNCDHPRNGHIPRPISPVEFRENILKIFRPTMIGQVSVPSFRRVNTLDFWRFNKVLCDVFRKVGEGQYGKVFAKNTHYTKEDLEALFAQKSIEFYIRNEDFERFFFNEGRRPFLALDPQRPNPAGPEEGLHLTHTLLLRSLVNLGLDEGLLKWADDFICSHLLRLQENEEIQQHLLRIRGMRDYLYDHSYVLAVLALVMARDGLHRPAADWDKLCQSALLHDITILTSDLAFIGDFNLSKLQSLGQKERDNYKNHPQMCADLIRKAGFFHPDVERIILQHHLEDPCGLSLPPEVAQEDLLPLSEIMIVAHEMTNLLFRNELGPLSLDSLFQQLDRKFERKSMKVLVQTLRQCWGG